MTADWAMAPLPWQADSWHRVSQQVDKDRLPHALLAVGAPGIGKYRFAQALAARLLCQQVAAGVACGQCHACELLNAGTHPDLLLLAPEEDSRQIKIDQVRATVEFVARTPAISPRKVIVIDPADAMNLNAANALLKSLEEPGASTVFLLLSDQPSMLPATIRSRCQRLDLALPGREQTLPWLAAIVGGEKEAESLLAAASGRPVEALALFTGDGLAERVALDRAMDELASGRLTPMDFPALVKDLDLEEVLALFQQRLERAIRDLAGAGGIASVSLFRLRDDLARQRGAVARGANPNRQLIIEDCATRLGASLGEIQS